MSINNHDKYDHSIDKRYHRLYARFLLGITMTTDVKAIRQRHGQGMIDHPDIEISTILNTSKTKQSIKCTSKTRLM